MANSSEAATRSRNKTYDINFVDEDETELDRRRYVAQDWNADDIPLDIFLAEEDPDALLIQNFEDTVVAHCYTAYLEARKRLTE
eukprot:Skav228508  [mRNA]  locus=scaffold1858:52644:53740:- [translate_table: standard]